MIKGDLVITTFMVLLFIFCVALVVEHEVHNYNNNKKNKKQ